MLNLKKLKEFFFWVEAVLGNQGKIIMWEVAYVSKG